MSAPEISAEMFEGKNFDERVKLRKELIAKYGTSLPKKDAPSTLFGLKKKQVKDEKGNVLPALGDMDAFEGLTFDERVNIRSKMIAAYGSSLPEADVEKKGGNNKKSQEDSKQSSFNERVQKRRIIHRILQNPNISKSLKDDLETNMDEYIEDPNIFIEEDGQVKYLTTSKERKRVVYEI